MTIKSTMLDLYISIHKTDQPLLLLLLIKSTVYKYLGRHENYKSDHMHGLLWGLLMAFPDPRHPDLGKK